MASAKKRFIPDRGDAVWIDFHPQSGHEQTGRRPALILSPASYNGLVGLALACPITSQIKGFPFEVPLPTGFGVNGVVLSDHVKSIDWKSRRAEWICTFPLPVVAQVCRHLQPLLMPSNS